MPLVQIDIIKRRDPEQKRALIRLVTDAVCEATGAGPEGVWVIVREGSPDDFGAGGLSATDRGIT